MRSESRGGGLGRLRCCRGLLLRLLLLLLPRHVSFWSLEALSALFEETVEERLFAGPWSLLPSAGRGQPRRVVGVAQVLGMSVRVEWGVGAEGRVVVGELVRGRRPVRGNPDVLADRAFIVVGHTAVTAPGRRSHERFRPFASREHGPIQLQRRLRCDHRRRRRRRFLNNSHSSSTRRSSRVQRKENSSRQICRVRQGGGRAEVVEQPRTRQEGQGPGRIKRRWRTRRCHHWIGAARQAGASWRVRVGNSERGACWRGSSGGQASRPELIVHLALLLLRASLQLGSRHRAVASGGSVHGGGLQQQRLFLLLPRGVSQRLELASLHSGLGAQGCHLGLEQLQSIVRLRLLLRGVNRR